MLLTYALCPERYAAPTADRLIYLEGKEIFGVAVASERYFRIQRVKTHAIQAQ